MPRPGPSDGGLRDATSPPCTQKSQSSAPGSSLRVWCGAVLSATRPRSTDCRAAIIPSWAIAGCEPVRPKGDGTQHGEYDHTAAGNHGGEEDTGAPSYECRCKPPLAQDHENQRDREQSTDHHERAYRVNTSEAGEP